MTIVKGCLIACALYSAACSRAVQEPSPLASYAPGQGQGRSASQHVAAGDAAWARRGEPGQAARAQGFYLDAAVADGKRADALLRAMRALTYRIEFERGVAREKLAQTAVELGQWCQRRAPAEAECDYRLAIALGQLARERPSVGKDALSRMVSLLERAIAAAPMLDSAGPHRVLAMVLMRAPGWPLGPGDTDAALEHAREAVRLAPRDAANQLVLGDALAATDHAAEARAAYTTAMQLATSARNAGDPDAARWLAEARAGLAKTQG